MKRVFVALVGLLSCYCCFAMTGNQLHEICQMSSVSAQQTCMYYIWGSFEGMHAMNELDTLVASDAAIAKGYCLPDGVTAVQIADIVKRFITDTPELRHGSASAMIYTGLSKVYPCK